MAFGKGKKNDSDRHLVVELNDKIQELERTQAHEKSLLQASVASSLRECTESVEQLEMCRTTVEEMKTAATELEKERDMHYENVLVQEKELSSLQGRIFELEGKAEEATYVLAEERKEREEMSLHFEEKKKEMKDMIGKMGNLEKVGDTSSGDLKKAMLRVNELEIQLAKAQKSADSSSSNLRTEMRELEEGMKEKEKLYLEIKLSSETQSAKSALNVEKAENKISQLNEEIVLLAMCGEASDPKNVLKQTVLQLQREMFEKSSQLVAQCEKHMQISEKLAKVKASHDTLKTQVKETRQFLLVGISGTDIDESLYQHIPLYELICMRMKTLEGDLMQAHQLLAGTESTEVSKVPSPAFLKEGTEILGSVGKLEREMRILRSRNKKLMLHSDKLEQELQGALCVSQDVRALKNKTAELAGRQRNERSMRTRSEVESRQMQQQVDDLSDHIEKLMVHLKHEAAAKAKAVELHTRSERDGHELQVVLSTLTRQSKSKDRTIKELNEASKIFGDQLRLLDDKQKDFRRKLHWTRDDSTKKLKKLEEETSMLRVKWHMAIDMGLLKDTFDVGPIIKQLEKDKSIVEAAKKVALEQEQEKEPEDVRVEGPTGFQLPDIPGSNVERDLPWSDTKLKSLTQQQNALQQTT